MTPEQDDQSHAQAEQMTNFFVHLGLFLLVAALGAAVAFFVGEWLWWMAMLAGWGLVIVGQALYVFIFNRIRRGGEAESAAIEEVAEKRQ